MVWWPSGEDADLPLGRLRVYSKVAADISLLGAKRKKICSELQVGIRTGSQPVNAQIHPVALTLLQIKELQSHKREFHVAIQKGSN